MCGGGVGGGGPDAGWYMKRKNMMSKNLNPELQAAFLCLTLHKLLTHQVICKECKLHSQEMCVNLEPSLLIITCGNPVLAPSVTLLTTVISRSQSGSEDYGQPGQIHYMLSGPDKAIHR